MFMGRPSSCKIYNKRKYFVYLAIMMVCIVDIHEHIYIEREREDFFKKLLHNFHISLFPG